MGATAVLQHEAIEVYDYRCSAGPGDRPFAELHDRFSVAYVRKGSFGYRVRGRVVRAGRRLPPGRPARRRIHVHARPPRLRRRVPVLPAHARRGGDHRCQAAFVAFRRVCRRLPELMVLGELAQAAADGRSDVGAR